MGIVGRRTASSIFYGMVGKITSTLIAFAGSVVLARILGPDYYGLAFALIALPQSLVSLVDLGLNGVIVRYGSRNEWDTALSASIIRVILIIGMSMALIVFSRDIAYAFNRPYIIKYMPVVILYFLFYSLDMLAGALVGALGLFRIGNVTLIVKNIVRVAIAITLALLGFGAISVVWGLVISYGFETLVLSLIAIYKLKSNVIRLLSDVKVFVRGARESLVMIAPLIANIIVGSVTSPIISIFQVRYSSNELLGNYNAATNVASVLDGLVGVIGGGLTFGITVSKDREIIEKAFVKGTMYSTLIISFLATGSAILANQVIAVLYGGKYVYGGLMFMLQAVALYSVMLGQYGAFLWAIGDTKLMSLTGVLSTLAWDVEAIVLILLFGGAWGFIYAALLSAYTGGLITLILVYRVYKVLPDFMANLRALMPSVIAGAIIYPFTLFLTPKMALTLIIPYALLFMLFTSLFLRTKEINELMRIVLTDKVLRIVLFKPLLLMLKINTYFYNISWLQKALYYDDK